MKKENIILIWKENGRKYQKEIERQKFYNLMSSIKDAFAENDISAQLTELVPNLVSITIDKDRNAEKDVPAIYCQYEDKAGEDDIRQEDTRYIAIKRYHKIMWGILDKLCEEEKK